MIRYRRQTAGGGSIENHCIGNRCGICRPAAVLGRKKAAASSMTVKKDKGIVGIGKMNKDINKKVAFKIFYNSTEVKPFPK